MNEKGKKQSSEKRNGKKFKSEMATLTLSHTNIGNSKEGHMNYSARTNENWDMAICQL